MAMRMRAIGGAMMMLAVLGTNAARAATALRRVIDELHSLDIMLASHYG